MNAALSKDQLQQILPLLDEALDHPPDKRAQWFDTDSRIAALDEATRAALQRMIVNSSADDEPLGELPLLETQGSSTVSYVAGDQIGPYQLVAPLGRGGMAEVWRASRSDGAYRREVALKLPLAVSGAARAHFDRRSQRERDVLATLEHPHIARFYDAGIAATRLGEQAYLALELIDGEPIDAYAKRMQLSLAAKCSLMQQVLSAVQYAHERLIVHRDLKPTNILVRRDGHVALLDFGIAKLLSAESDINDDVALTREMGAAVTPAYAAPEQLQGGAISTSTDVFSAGVVLFELLTGVRPFATIREGGVSNLSNILDAMRRGEAPTLAAAFLSAPSGVAIDATSQNEPSRSAAAKTLRGDVSAIVAKAIRIQPNERYATAQAFHNDLSAYLSHRPVAAREGARWYYAKKFLVRHRVPMLIGALGVSAVTVASVVALTQRATAQANTAQATAVQSLLDSLFAGMSPDLAETRTYTTKELLDRARTSLPSKPETEHDFALGLRFAELYRSIGEHVSATALVAPYAQTAQAHGKYDWTTRLKLFEALSAFDQANLEVAEQALAAARAAASNARYLSPLAKTQLDYAEALSRFHRGELKQANSLFSAIEQNAVATSNEMQALNAQATQMRANTLWLLQQYDAAKSTFENAINKYSVLGEKFASARMQAVIQHAQMELDRAEYGSAIEILLTVKKEVDERFAPTHSVRMLGDYVLAASELYAGRLADARRSVEYYANVSVGNEAHQQPAIRLLASERMYRCDTEAALAVLSPHVGTALKPDQTFSLNDALNRRLRAEILSRANRDNEASAEIDALFSHLKRHEQMPGAARTLAYARFTMAVIELRDGRNLQAAELLAQAEPVFDAEFSATDLTTQAYFGYQTIVSARLGNTEKNNFYRQKVVSSAWPRWQRGAPEMLEIIQNKRADHSRLPFVM